MTTRCRRCKRPLANQKSVPRGYGQKCGEIEVVKLIRRLLRKKISDAELVDLLKGSRFFDHQRKEAFTDPRQQELYT